MLSTELKNLMTQLENGEQISIDRIKTLQELRALDEVKEYFQESLSLSSEVCPTCGRRL